MDEIEAGEAFIDDNAPAFQILAQTAPETVVTYMVKDRSGMTRGRGIPSQEDARRIIENLMQNEFGQRPYTIERVTYVSFTNREVIETVEEEK